MAHQRESRDFFLISELPDAVLVNHRKAPLALAVLTGMVVAAAFEWLSMLQAATMAAIIMLLTRSVSLSLARKSVEWNVLIVIAAALGIGQALDKTGAAAAIAGGLVNLASDAPWVSLAMVYLATTLLTEFVTNNAAVALLFPIAVNVAFRLHVNPMPFVICIMIAASASFATPIGYQTNLMVYGPGGYKFTDFLKVGIPMNILIGLVSILLAPFI